MTTNAYQNCTLYSFNSKSKECDNNLNRLVELNNQLNDKIEKSNIQYDIPACKEPEKMSKSEI